nr:SMP-30/gluconolactonase/LRE family protein [bacterium]
MKCLLHAAGDLLEGPLWDDKTGTLYFVDYPENTVHALTGDRHRLYRLPSGPGSLALFEDGTLLVATKKGLLRLYPQSGAMQFLHRPQAPLTQHFNDGKCDPFGNFLVGTNAGQGGQGTLFCATSFASRAILGGVQISNGIAFSADGQTLYYIDSPLRTIDAFTYRQGGHLSNRRTVFSLPQGAEAVPDGQCIDENGNLWVALWDGGEVLHINPSTGQVLHRIAMPDTRPTCAAFGGPGLATLFVTTARDEAGLGGSLYALDVGVCGLPVPRFAG